MWCVSFEYIARPITKYSRWIDSGSTLTCQVASQSGFVTGKVELRGYVCLSLFMPMGILA